MDRVEARAAWTETSARLTQAAAVPPGPLGPPLVLAQQLADRGVEFEVLGRNWLLQKTWKPADPSKVARELSQEEPQLRARAEGEDWIPLASATRLGQYHAFHGGSPDGLDDPALGQALSAIHTPGAAFLAYTSMPKSDREATLFRAFEQGKLEADRLTRPALAEGLQSLAEEGYHLSSGTPLATYLRSDNPDVTISYDNLPLARTKLEQLHTPPDLHPLKVQAESLREKAGQQTEEAWALVQGDGSSRPLSERVDLAARVLGPDLPTLYPAVLRNAPDRAPLQPTLDELQDLARSLPARTAVEALELGRKEGYDPVHWRQSVADTRDLDLARRALAAVEGKDYPARQKAFQQLAALSPRWAVETAEELGPQLPSRGPELARLAQDVLPPEEALEAWRYCRQQNLPFEPDRLEASRELLTLAGLEPGDWTRVYSALPAKEHRQPLLDLARNLQPFKPTLDGLGEALSLPPDSHSEVGQLAARMENADHAVATWNLLQPDYEERHETFEQMVAQKGWDQARAAYRELASPNDARPWSARVELLRVADESWPDQRLETYRALRDANLDAAQLKAFSQLSGQLGLKKEGDWALEDNRWANKLYIGASPKNSLELPAFSLANLTGCRLELDRKLDLRAEKNKAYVEASQDGKTWAHLADLEKTSSIDLSRYDGKQLHLRFVVAPEHWDQNGPGEALVISDLRITGQSLGQTVQVASQAELSGPGALLTQPTELPALAALAGAVGGPRQALGLSQLAPSQDWPALGALASQVGAPAAAQIWPRLGGEKEARAVALVADLSEPQTPLETLLERTRQLGALELSVAGLEGLGKLASEQPEWKSTGAWDCDGQSWSNRLYIGAGFQNELISPPLSLAHLKEPRLRLSERHDLRVDGNLAEIQVAEDGPNLEWVKLTDLKGTSTAWQDLELDLTRFQGKTVRLRFDVKPKSWSNDGPGEALSIRDLSLEGRSPWGPVSTPLGQAGSLFDQALDGLTHLPEEKREEALQALGQLAGGLGDARQTLELWPLLLARPENLSERSSALTELAGRMGPAAARSAWPLVDEDGGAEPRRVQWLDLAARTAPEGARLADLEPLYRQLCSQPLDETAITALEGVLTHRPTWTREGVWETRQDPERGPVWSSRLFIGAGRLNQLTSSPIKLTNLSSARAVYSHKQDLRAEKSEAHLEITDDGGKTWTRLQSYRGSKPTDWAPGEADLSAYVSKTVQLRLRVDPDHWDNNGPGDAFELAGLKVVGRSSPSAPEQTVFEESRNSGLVARALQAAEGNSASMVALGELSETLGDSEQALRLWPSLAPELGKPDFEQRKKALLDLASATGGQRAAEAWPLVSTEGPPDLALRGRLYSLASRLSESSGLAADDLYRKMGALDVQALSDAESLAGSMPDWTSVGTWSRGEGSTWINRLFIGAPLEHHLTSPPLPLAGLTDVRLEFVEKHDLRAEGNTAGVEVSSDGDTYASLEQFPGLLSDWTGRSVDLSAFSGQTVQLRFRVRPKTWTQDGPGEALGVRDVLLKGRFQGSEVTMDLQSLQGSAVQALAASSPESLRALAQLGPDQAWRLLGSLGQAQAMGLLEGRDLGKCLTRVLQSVIVGDSLERAMESMLEGDGQSVGESESAVIVGGVRVGKRRG